MPDMQTVQSSDVLLSVEEMISNYLMRLAQLKKEQKEAKVAFDISLMGYVEYSEADKAVKEAQKAKKAARERAMSNPALAQLADNLKSLGQSKKESQLSLSDYLLERERMTGQLAFDFAGEQLAVVKSAKLVKPKKAWKQN